MSSSSMELVAGMKGSGKSFYVKEKIKNAKNLICFDLQNEYQGDPCYTVAAAIRNINANLFPLRYIPVNGDEDELFEELREFENLTVVIDEASAYITAYDKKTPLFLYTRLIRHLHVDLILITQRFQDFPKQLISQASKLTTFRQWLPDDIKTLVSWGFDETELKSLKNYEKITIEK